MTTETSTTVVEVQEHHLVQLGERGRLLATGARDSLAPPR
jgi:hypothetical protein